MCILFFYNAFNEADSDYALILATNRDEYLDRPSECMLPWREDSNVYGGRDLEPASEGGAWLALNTAYQKLGILLNLPGKKKENALSRGKVVADYVKSNTSILDYVESLKKYDQKCNEFIFVSVEYRNMVPDIKTYSNASNKTDTWTDTCLGFGNSLPENPLTKVKSGKSMMREICTKYNKVENKKQLIEELIMLLRNKNMWLQESPKPVCVNKEMNVEEARHVCKNIDIWHLILFAYLMRDLGNLPDPQLESRHPIGFEQLSSIFVAIPGVKYGTRTHTIFLLTKTGHIDFIEITMDSPINIENPTWKRTEYEFDVPMKNQL